MDTEATAGAAGHADPGHGRPGETLADAPAESPADPAGGPVRASRGGEDTGLRIADRYVVSPGIALPGYDSPRARAVAASDIRNPTRAMMALLTPHHLGLREDVLGAARRIERGHVLRPADWASLDWPMLAGQRLRQPVVIVERPGGARVMARDGHIDPFSEDTVVRRVLRPLANALRDVHGVGLTHRAVRPDNLFWRDGGAAEAVLGEGWTSLPGADQPVLCETISNGMALPAGRGGGRPPDDLYALGATLVVLLSGMNPVAKLDDHALVAAKINLGSFAALAGNLRLSTPMAEVLRGLLADEAPERWTLDDLDLWFDGRRLSPKAPNLPAQAARPLNFGDVNHLTRQGLSHGLAARWPQAIPFVAEAGLAVWLKRSLGEEKRSGLVNAALSGSAEAGRSGADHQLARVLMILDPAAPVRLREIALQVDGLGALLADSFDNGPVIQQIAQVVIQKLPAIWVDLQEDPRVEHGLVRKSLDMMNFFLGKTTPGFGLERCLYELNPTTPCRSPVIEADYVTRIGELLFYLDRAAGRSEPTTVLIDRHVAAFIGARLGNAADSDLTRLGTAEQAPDRCIALLRVLAMVQAATGLHELPDLGNWVAAQLKPLLESFHHRPFKDALAKEIGPLCYRGDFAGLVRLVENDGLRQRDETGFAAARKQYATLQQEAEWIRGGGLTSAQRLAMVAQQTAAITAGSVAAIATGAVMVFLMS